MRAYSPMLKPHYQNKEINSSKTTFRQTSGFAGDIEQLKSVVDHFSNLLSEGSTELENEIKNYNASNDTLNVRHNSFTHLIEINFNDRYTIIRPSALINYATYEVSLKYQGETINSYPINYKKK